MKRRGCGWRRRWRPLSPKSAGICILVFFHPLVVVEKELVPVFSALFQLDGGVSGFGALNHKMGVRRVFLCFWA